MQKSFNIASRMYKRYKPAKIKMWAMKLYKGKVHAPMRALQGRRNRSGRSGFGRYTF